MWAHGGVREQAAAAGVGPYTAPPVADLPITLEPVEAARLAGALDVEGKIPRALEALGPVAGCDVVLVDAAGGLRARQLAEIGARLTLLERTPEAAEALRRQVADLRRVSVVEGSAAATNLGTGAADRVVSYWSAFRNDLPGEVAEADRVLRAHGRLLVLHDYGRDDVSRLRSPDLPEYGSWSRRDGWFLRNGFKVRVLHCWWTFESVEGAQAFLENAFGSAGRDVGSGMRRPRLSYNVAVYHRTKGAAGDDAAPADR